VKCLKDQNILLEYNIDFINKNTFLRLNEAENTVRALSLLFILLSPQKEMVQILAPFLAFTVFFLEIVLKMHIASAGILQLIMLINSDSLAVFKFLGIDSVAIWKIRATHVGISLIGITALLWNQIMPVFYYRLIRETVPKNTWFIILSTNTLVFVSFKLIILVQLYKTFNNWKILRKVSQSIHEAFCSQKASNYSLCPGQFESFFDF
jgi:hypothetical protein